MYKLTIVSIRIAVKVMQLVRGFDHRSLLLLVTKCFVTDEDLYN